MIGQAFTCTGVMIRSAAEEMIIDKPGTAEMFFHQLYLFSGWIYSIFESLMNHVYNYTPFIVRCNQLLSHGSALPFQPSRMVVFSR
jgi:hypothetical protein